MGYKEALGEHAILRRITGLKSVQFKSRPAKYKTTPEAFARKDQDTDGEFLEDFQNNVIPGAVTGLAPFWNDLKDSFWGENREILNELVKEIKLRFPDDHPDKPRMVITPEDVDPRNFFDAFFQHNDLKKKRMEGGVYTFNLQSDPIDALLYYCYRFNPKVLIRDGREISKYTVGAAKYELIIPKERMLESKASMKKEIDAMTLFSGLDYEKQKLIAYVMNLRVNDRDNPNPDLLFVELGKTAKDNTLNARFGMTNQDKFVQLAKLKNEDLLMVVDIEKAIEHRIIVFQRNETFLNSEKLPNITNRDELLTYFKSEKGREHYKDLIFLIGEKSKQPT